MGDEVLARAILDSLPGAALVAFDRTLRVIACAGEPLAGRGVDRAIVVGQRLPEQLGTAAFAVHGPHYARALAGETSSLETETVDHARIYATEFSPLREPDGTVRGGIAVSREVTDARRAQMTLATSERRLCELADECSDAQVRLRPDGVFLFVSRAAERLVGSSCEELVGTNAYELVHEHDLARITERREELVHAEGTVRLEARLRHRDASWRLCEATVRMVRDPATGRLVEVHGSVRDIRDRREGEQQRWRWEQTFDSTTRGICVLDADTDLIESVNPAFARMHGGATADFDGQPISVMITPEQGAQLPRIMSKIDEQDFVRVESEHVRLDGSRFPVMAEVLLVRDPRGRLLSRTVWLEDLTERRAAEAARQEATEIYETAFSAAPMGVALIGFDGRFLRVNAALCEMLGRPEDQLIGSTSRSFTHPADMELTADAFAHLTTFGTPLSVQKRYLRADGAVVWAQTRGTAVTGVHGGPGYIVSHFLDITAIKVAELRQAEATARFETAFADAPIGMAIVGLDGGLVRVNRILCQLSGYTEAQLLRLAAEDLMHPDDRGVNRENVMRLLAGEIHRYTVEQRFYTAERQPIWTTLAVSLVRDPEGRPLHFISQLEDISERRRLEAELQHLADHDPLTELWNRRRFDEELERQVARCQRYAEHAALLLIDLNGFKQVNDTNGHQAGDDLLVTIAAALQRRLRATDSLFRLGGDEFAVILTNVSLEQAERIESKLAETISLAGISVNGTNVCVTGSIGVAALDSTSQRKQDAYVEADEAMYRAKAASGRPRERSRPPGA
jgi:diguanylate cyclase (GGDEF)-like protein/PAS domain S-box-containing protein